MTDKKCIESYIYLASAIVFSGIHEKDKKFLQSEWCQYLKEIVIEWTNAKNATTIVVPNLTF